jgi:hypothetical protein
MRTLVRSLPALLGLLATAALSADVNDKKDKRLTAELYFQWEDAQKKEARMVRVPDEPHGIRNHPSHYIAKILFIQDWFEKHKRNQKTSSN